MLVSMTNAYGGILKFAFLFIIKIQNFASTLDIYTLTSQEYQHILAKNVIEWEFGKL